MAIPEEQKTIDNRVPHTSICNVFASFAVICNLLKNCVQLYHVQATVSVQFINGIKTERLVLRLCFVKSNSYFFRYVYQVTVKPRRLAYSIQPISSTEVNITSTQALKLFLCYFSVTYFRQLLSWGYVGVCGWNFYFSKQPWNKPILNSNRSLRLFYAVRQNAAITV